MGRLGLVSNRDTASPVQARLQFPPGQTISLHGPRAAAPRGFERVDARELARLELPPETPATESITRGQAVRAAINGEAIEGVLRGCDYRGRPVILDAGGKRRIGDWGNVEIDGVEEAHLSPVDGLREGVIVRPPEKLRAALDAAFDVQVTGPHTAREYLDALHAGGYPVYLTGGAIRDAIYVHATKAGATVEDILDKLKDVDVVTTAPPPVVRELCAKIAPEYPNGAVWSPPVVDQFGSVLVGGPKAKLENPEGLDINTLRSDGAFEEQELHSDTGEKAHPYTFDHSLWDDAGTRDFACNAIYWDPINKVLIDPTGHGIADAQKMMLRISRRSCLEKDDNIALRFWKFRMRGFTGEPETQRLLRSQAKRALWSMPRWKVVLNVARIAPKTARTPEEVRDFLVKLEAIMEQDGCGDLYRRRIRPLTDKIVGKIVRRFEKAAA